MQGSTIADRARSLKHLNDPQVRGVFYMGAFQVADILTEIDPARLQEAIHRLHREAADAVAAAALGFAQRMTPAEREAVEAIASDIKQYVAMEPPKGGE